MLIEVSVLQRFVLLLGHPVYSLTVTLFSLLLGTGIGAAWSRRLRRRDARALDGDHAGRHRRASASRVIAVVTPLVAWAIPFARAAAHCHRGRDARADRRRARAFRCRPASGCCSARAPQMVTWAWGINGALSVVGATLAIFIAMNWGFGVTLIGGLRNLPRSG